VAKLTQLQLKNGQLQKLEIEGAGWQVSYDPELSVLKFQPLHTCPGTQTIEIPLESNGWIWIGGVCMYSTEQKEFVKRKKEEERMRKE